MILPGDLVIIRPLARYGAVLAVTEPYVRAVVVDTETGVQGETWEGKTDELRLVWRERKVA